MRQRGRPSAADIHCQGQPVPKQLCPTQVAILLLTPRQWLAPIAAVDVPSFPWHVNMRAVYEVAVGGEQSCGVE